jgi:UDP-GlcNAc:undecaprenyl-phosphate/decaprenyl-phosphate GlcNAc-1-phosphate transferase
VRLSVPESGGPAQEATPMPSFSTIFDGTVPATLRAQFVVPGGKAAEHVLELAWGDGRREIDRDTEIAIDMLCEYLAEAFENLRMVPVASQPASGIEPHA